VFPTHLRKVRCHGRTHLPASAPADLPWCNRLPLGWAHPASVSASVPALAAATGVPPTSGEAARAALHRPAT
jgi:hypothetical protein